MPKFYMPRFSPQYVTSLLPRPLSVQLAFSAPTECKAIAGQPNVNFPTQILAEISPPNSKGVLAERARFGTWCPL